MTDQQSSKNRLRECLRRGDMLLIVHRSTSRSGLTRRYDVYLSTGRRRNQRPPGIWWLSRDIALACGYRYNQREQCLEVDGCGFNAADDIARSVATVVFPRWRRPNCPFRHTVL